MSRRKTHLPSPSPQRMACHSTAMRRTLGEKLLPKIDWTLSAGNILQIVLLVLAALMFFRDSDNRLKSLEISRNEGIIIQKETTAAMQRLSEEIWSLRVQIAAQNARTNARDDRTDREEEQKRNGRAH